jgi:DNA-binding CsgD family transcriptional regulator/DNA-binding beta-propeller fold protein YncE
MRRHGLTRREREVLDLLRLGLTNEEVAQRLGVTLDGAKYHVSQILSKLGVASRDEAAAFVLADARPRWQRLFIPFGWPLAVKAAAVTTAIAAAAGLGVAVWALVASGGSTEEVPTAGDITAPNHLLYLVGESRSSSGEDITVVDPASQQVLHTIPVGYDPQIVLSADGSTLYLTDSQPSGDTLSVIDTRDWRVLTQVSSPDRIKDIGIGLYAMAVSPKGRHLYIHKWNGGSAHWWDIFDTSTQEFAPNPPHVADCGIAQAFPPLGASSSLAILCHELNALVFVDLPSGNILGTVSTYNQASLGRCASGEDIAAARQAPDGTIYLVTKGGCVLAVDTGEMAVKSTFRMDLPADWRVPYDLIALSAAGDRLFVGVGPGTSSDGREIWTFDLQTQSRASAIRLEQSAWGIALSPDGRLLYAVNPVPDSLFAVDLGTGQQLWIMTDLPGDPWVVQVAPRPSATVEARPDVVPGWQTYRDPGGRFQFQYPVVPLASGPTPEPPQGTVRIQLPFAAGTNLVEKYVDIEAHSPYEKIVCFELPNSTVIFNGTEFKMTHRDGVATGSIYETWAYTTVGRDGSCLRISFTLHSGNRANYPSPPPELDSAAESTVFERIMSTFTWLDSSGG